MGVSVRLNGRESELPDGATLGDAVAALAATPVGVAAALDDEVVPRSAWGSTPLRAGARVEVLTAVQGG